MEQEFKAKYNTLYFVPKCVIFARQKYEAV